MNHHAETHQHNHRDSHRLRSSHMSCRRVRSILWCHEKTLALYILQTLQMSWLHRNVEQTVTCIDLKQLTKGQVGGL